MPFHTEALEQAIKFGFNIAISIDYLTAAQWQILQKVIVQLNSQIQKKYKDFALKGVIVWRVSEDEDFQGILEKMKTWLVLNNMWLFYANTNNVLFADTPPGILMPDGFVLPDDNIEHMEEMCDFVFNQGLYKSKAILLIKPSAQHLDRFADWLQKNIDSITLENWSKKGK